MPLGLHLDIWSRFGPFCRLSLRRCMARERESLVSGSTDVLCLVLSRLVSSNLDLDLCHRVETSRILFDCVILYGTTGPAF